MNIVVPIQQVPDLAEELVIAESGDALDRTFMRLIPNELDDQAIEQALLLKEQVGGSVSVVGLDDEGVDEIFFAASAKGADRLIKLTGADATGMNNHARARALVPVVEDLHPDLILTGVQAHNDLDGSLGPLLAEYLRFPYIGYIAGIEFADGSCISRKEHPGGLVAQMEVTLPAVLGVQVADEPPRYVAISRIRQAMRTAAIEQRSTEAWDPSGGPTVARLFKPEVSEKATMIEGDDREIARRLIGIFQDLGVLKTGRQS